MRSLRIFFVLLGAAIRGQAQYRGNLLLLLVGGFAYQGAGFAFIWMVLDRFGALGGWTLPEVVFLFALRLTAHGVWVVFFNQLLHVDEVVREGEFDRFLVRPVDPLVQLLTRRIRLTAFGDFLGGAILLAFAASMVPVDWSPMALLYLLTAILGGALVEASFQLFLSSLSFRLLNTGGLRWIFDDLFTIFGGYPLKVFPSAAQFALTFVVPLAFVAYIPATVLLARTDELAVSSVVAWFAPLLGFAMLFGAYRFWRTQTKYYSSSGH